MCHMNSELISRDALLELARSHVGGTVDCNDIARMPAVVGTAILWRSPKDAPPMLKPILVCREKEPGMIIVQEGMRKPGEWWKVYGTRVKRIIAWAEMPAPPEVNARNA